MKRSQGEGEGTPYKGEGIIDILRICEKFSRGTGEVFVRRGYPFWYIDLNCGIGWNEEINCAGSPINFLRVMSETGRKYKALFCDNDKDDNGVWVVDILKSRLEKVGHPTAKNEIRYWPDTATNENLKLRKNKDNKFALSEFATWIRANERQPEEAVGAVLSDPNGPSVDGFPLKEIAKFASHFPKVDIILNVNITKMLGCLTVSKNEKYEGFIDNWPAKNLREIMKYVPKQHWLVREPVWSKGYYYTLLCGRNLRAGNHPKLGFYDAKQGRGFQIVQSACRSKKELSV